MSSYSPDLNKTEAAPEQSGREAEHEITRTLAGPGNQAAASGADPAGAGNPAAALHTVSAGIRSGISPLQFMDSIDAGARQMGNRGFMHWVEQLHGEGQAGATHEIAAQGLQGPGRPLTHLDTLQRAFGHHDIRGMREHTGPVAGTALEALDAEGYTRGGRMALAGTPDLYTQAHEAAHGVQQAALGNGMALPGGIGVAGDRYERQADAVAEAVLRGASAQPLLDRVSAGPVQVNAAAVSAAAPVQMRRRKQRRADAPRPGNAPGQDLPAAEQEAVEMADVAGQPEAQAPAGGGVDPQELAAALEQVQQAAGEAADVAAEPAQQQAAGGNAANQQPGDGERDYLATIANYLFPGAQPAGNNDTRATGERYFTYFFPALTYLYSCLKERAGQVQTDEHGACSLRGILNMLATVMFGVMMVAPGLPLDVINNVLGGVAKVIVIISSILGLPADWLLKLYQKKYPPEQEDIARAEADDALIYLPRHIPEWLTTLASSAYFQAAISQGSISPSQWLQPWSPLRISIIVARSITDLVLINMLFGGLTDWISKNVLKEKLGWGPTRSTVYVLSLGATFAPVIDYISSYLLNPELSIYLVYQNILEENDYRSSGAATGLFIGYAALGMLLQYLAGILLMFFLLFRIGAGNDKWRKQFYTISNRLLRYIAVFLASARNMIINVLSLSNFAALVVTNIIGPLAREFGQGGACLWPLAAADVCGGLPGDFDFIAFAKEINQGKDNLPPEHLDIIRAFPGLVGVLGLGIPIATVIALLCRKRWTGRGAAEPDREAGRAGRRDRARGTGRGTPVPAPRGRRAAGRGRARLVEEDAEAGRRADKDEGQATPRIYDRISSLFGTMRRQRRRGHPQPRTMVNTAALNLPEGLTPGAACLCRLSLETSNPVSFIQERIRRYVDYDDITQEDLRLIMAWVEQYLLPAADAPEPGQTATAVIESQYSLATAVTVQAGGESAPAGLTGEETTTDHRDSNLPEEEQLALAETNIPRRISVPARFMCWQVIHIVPPSQFTPDYVQKIIQLNAGRGNITEAEARLASVWARHYLFPQAPEPGRRSGTASSSASSGYIHMSGTAQTTHASPTWTDYDPATSGTGSTASATSLHAASQAVYTDLLSMAGQLTVEEMERRLREEIEKRRLTEEEAAEIRRRLEDVVLFPRQS